MYATDGQTADGQTKATLIAPFPTGGGITNVVQETCIVVQCSVNRHISVRRDCMFVCSPSQQISLAEIALQPLAMRYRRETWYIGV